MVIVCLQNHPGPDGTGWFISSPPLAIIVGAYILYRALRSWRHSEEDEVEDDQPEVKIDDDYVAQIEEELRNR